MAAQKRTTTHGTLIAEEMNRDPEFRDEWERTALARMVAAQLIGFRADNELSQRKLADRLGMKQPYVARLESGETNPDFETLVKIARELGTEFMIDIRRAGAKPKLITKGIVEKHQGVERDGVAVTVAAAVSSA